MEHEGTELVEKITKKRMSKQSWTDHSDFLILGS